MLALEEKRKRERALDGHDAPGAFGRGEGPLQHDL